MKTVNPLRYPGGKLWLVDYISQLLISNKLNGCTFYEPYAGSAIVSLTLIKKNLIDKAVLIEIDPLIYSFWKSVFLYTDELCERIEKIEITINTWKQMSRFRASKNLDKYSVVEVGLAGLFLNRTNYSGILTANPIGGIKQKSKYKLDCRFNKNNIINMIKNISEYSDRIQIINNDAIDFMKNNIKWKKNEKCFVYIDPPYYTEGQKLYRYYYTEKDHVNLAKFIKNKSFPWLISYDDHPFINKLYMYNKKLHSQHLYLDYTVRGNKRGRELLISNLILPPIPNQEISRCI